MVRPHRDTLAWILLAAGGGAVLVASSCSEGDAVTDTGGSSSAETSSSIATAASSGPATSSSTGAAGGSGGQGGGSGGQGGGSGGEGGGGTAGAGGTGGGSGWPTCDAQPANVPTKALHAIWQDDPAAPTAVWVPGVYVTAVSGGGCQAGVACQIFLQQATTYADLAAGAQQALKVFVSANTATHFVGIAVGDQVDAYAHAWRYDVDGQHELLLQVNLQLPGCAKKVGQGDAQPVTVTLDDLTVSAYEDTLGPLLIRVDAVSGTPANPGETFGLYPTSGPFSDAGIETVTSLSPFFLPGGVFTGLTPAKKHHFTSVTGVFGLFVPPNMMPVQKYEEIYPRTAADVVVESVDP